MAILGDYSVSVPFETFKKDDYRRGGDATPDLVLMPGARMLRTSEPEARARLAYPLSLRQVEDILLERGIDSTHKKVVLHCRRTNH